MPTLDDMSTHDPSHDIDRGFTFLEILVVITVIGVLATVVTAALRGSTDDAEGAARVADARILETAEAAYAATNGEYGSEDELVTAGHLRQPSELHDVVLDGDGFRLVPVGDSSSSDDRSGSVTTVPSTTVPPTTTPPTTVPPTTTPPTTVSVTTVPATTAPPTTVPPSRSPECVLTVTQAWGSGANADLTITNTSDRTMTAWTVRIDARGDRIWLWNATTLSSSRDSVTARNLRWNGTIAAGGTATPTGASIRGEHLRIGATYPCEMVTPQPSLDDVECDLDVTRTWRGGGSVRLTLRNDGEIDVSSWTVAVEAEDVTFTSWSGADVRRRDESHFTLSSQDWTSFVEAGGEMRSVTAQASGRLRRSTSFDCEVLELR